MVLIALMIALVAFAAVLRQARTLATASDAVAAAREAAAALARPDLDDATKEALSRRAAGRLFGSFLRIAAAGVVAFGLSLVVVWLGAAVGLYAFPAAMAMAVSLPFLLGASLAATLAWVLANRRTERTS